MLRTGSVNRTPLDLADQLEHGVERRPAAAGPGARGSRVPGSGRAVGVTSAGRRPRRCDEASQLPCGGAAGRVLRDRGPRRRDLGLRAGRPDVRLGSVTSSSAMPSRALPVSSCGHRLVLGRETPRRAPRASWRCSSLPKMTMLRPARYELPLVRGGVSCAVASMSSSRQVFSQTCVCPSMSWKPSARMSAGTVVECGVALQPGVVREPRRPRDRRSGRGSPASRRACPVGSRRSPAASR